ncbi:MAG: homoserine dehydrogenase [Anaerolineae bacterium]
MKTYRLALIGFGNVGQGLAQIIRDRGPKLADRFGLTLDIVAVTTLSRGAVYDPKGLNPGRLLAAMAEAGTLADVPAPFDGWDARQTIAGSNADIVVETSYSDLQTGEPAAGHIRLALEQGRPVVTANKGPIALHYRELADLAARAAPEVRLGFEGTVMSGTPALQLALDNLTGAGIREIKGILNGTTNYILTQMENGLTYDAALAEAQRLGYAEADPSADVEGFDAAGKVVILGNVLLNAGLTMDRVACTGITGLTPTDIDQARQAGERWKLIGQLRSTGNDLSASVKPMRLPLSHPLAGVMGVTNAITYSTDLLGDVTLIGPGAGGLETGYALLNDILAIHRRLGGER